MSSIRIVLETSDFSVERSTATQGWVNVMVYADDGDTVELELEPDVAGDLARALMNPEEPG